jgi:drug/metabolite transporter (DMT)-like permease
LEPPQRTRFLALDALLLLMVLIWGANFSVVKVAFSEIPEFGFNAIRLLGASLVFFLALGMTGTPRPSGRDALKLFLIAVPGQFLYQLCWMGGLARTSVANCALILGCSPVAVALATSAAGHERVAPIHWAGALLSVFGVYLVVGTGPTLSADSIAGDLLTLAAVFCWAVYTVGSRALLVRLSPLAVTGYTMAFGTLLYAPLGVSDLLHLDWSGLSARAWIGLAFSSIFSLALAYLIWYTAVQKIGNMRTAIYSNMVPIVAMAIAAIWLGERLTGEKLAGAAAILGGVGLTRLAGSARAIAPAEE